MQLDDQVATTAIDDVFPLAPVEMHRRHLCFAAMHDFLRIAFGIRLTAGRTVSQREQRQPLVSKILAAERRDVPAQLQVEYLLPRLTIELTPNGWAKVRKGRQMDVEAGKKMLGLLQNLVHGGTVHIASESGDEMRGLSSRPRR
ncbi:hypothetical protein D3C76_1334720 [compost metagenome]